MSNGFNFNTDNFSKKDELGFDPYADTLSSMIKDPNFKTPFCIGIYGKWGSGKTSFMHLLSERIGGDAVKPHIIPVWFNPWRYVKEDHLIIPFLKTIEQAIQVYIDGNEELGKPIKEGLAEAARKMGYVAAAFAYGISADFKLGGFGFTLDVAKAVERGKELGQQRIREAKALSDELSSIYYDIVNQLEGAVNEKEFRITVFIDDLDRCLPEKAIELLEAIKLFLDLEGYLFVIGVDQEIVEKGIACHYKHFDYDSEEKGKWSKAYLDKIIQFPLELPPIEPGKKLSYIQSLLTDENYKAHAGILEKGVRENPRILKRFVNFLAFMSRHAGTVRDNLLEDMDKALRNNQISDKDKKTFEIRIKLVKENFVPVLYIKWSLIVFEFNSIYKIIKDVRHRLIEMQAEAIGEIEAADDKTRKESVPIPPRLKEVLREGRLFPDDVWLISMFVHLTKITQVMVSEKEIKTEIPLEERAKWQPGDMVLINKGGFLYGDDKQERESDDDYYIGAFPVTNKQYRVFVEAGGYEESDYWSDNGWKWREEKKITEPEYWNDEKWNQPDYPVVGVSWYEADAYCRWLSESKEEDYRLPSEEEWEKAARGDNGREYPWGDEFDKLKCNTSESGIGKITPVNKYLEGVSPYGCYDMAGNVWDWTKTDYKTKKAFKSGDYGPVLRGGSWLNNYENARCAHRDMVLPNYRIFSISFRAVRTKKG